MKFCENCGGELKPGEKFCAHCGAPVLSASQPEPAPQPEPIAQPGLGAYQPPAHQNSGAYQPPVHGAYQPPAYQPPAYQNSGTYQSPEQATVKVKKPFNKKILLFGGIGVGVLILAVILILVLGRSKGGDAPSSDPYVGIWNATSVTMMEADFEADEIFEEGFRLELKSNGKCQLSTEGRRANGNWKKEDDGVRINLEGQIIFGEIKGSTMFINDYLETGMDVTLAKEGGKEDNLNIPDINDENHSTVQEIWNGSWYGYFWVVEAFNEWEDYDDSFYDAYMVLEVDEDGNGTMAIFIGDEEQQSIDAYIFADEYHFEVTEGVFWDMELDPSEWWLGISPADDGNLVVISDTYIDPELTADDGFEYMCCFRPFGELWIQEEREGDTLPPGYYDYVEALEAGVTDPNSWDLGSSDSEESVSSDSWDAYYGSGEADNASLRAGWDAISSANTGSKPSYEELCEIIGTKGRLNEYAEVKDNWLRVEWGSGTGFLRVDYMLEDGELVYVMAEKVGSFD